MSAVIVDEAMAQSFLAGNKYLEGFSFCLLKYYLLKSKYSLQKSSFAYQIAPYKIPPPATQGLE
jgi:hypothetical protein